jgi:hypothetical protein
MILFFIIIIIKFELNISNFDGVTLDECLQMNGQRGYTKLSVSDCSTITLIRLYSNHMYFM